MPTQEGQPGKSQSATSSNTCTDMDKKSNDPSLLFYHCGVDLGHRLLNCPCFEPGLLRLLRNESQSVSISELASIEKNQREIHAINTLHTFRSKKSASDHKLADLLEKLVSEETRPKCCNLHRNLVSFFNCFLRTAVFGGPLLCVAPRTKFTA